MCTYYLETGQVPVLNTHKCPRQEETTHLDRNASQVLWQLYDADAALNIDEATQILNNELGTNYSLHAVNRALRKLGLTSKVVSWVFQKPLQQYNTY